MRGYQKRVIFLKNTGSHLFDEAYFVLSKECEAAHIGQSDMVLEANRIIEESLKECAPVQEGRRGRFFTLVIPFLLGVIFTVGAAMIYNFSVGLL